MNLFDFFKKKTNSGSVAKDRLQLVLVHDRLNCSEDVIEKIKADIIEVISRHVDIDMQEFNVEIDTVEVNGGMSPVLSANIPIKSVKKS